MENPFSPSPKDSPPLARPGPDAPASTDLLRRPGYGGYGYGYAAANAQVNNGNAQSGGLLEYWRILRHQKGTWLICTFIGASSAFWPPSPKPPYTKHAPLSKSRASTKIS